MKKAILAVAAMAATGLMADTVIFGNQAAESSQFSTRSVAAPQQPAAPADGFTPFAISLFPPAQFPAETWDVYGHRINVFVGRAKNPAHQNSELPIGFDIKMGIVEKLSGYLGDMGKRVRVSYF